MGIKAQEMIDGCLAKAAPGELIFVLRETDDSAPDLIREWAARFRQRHIDAGTAGPRQAKAILKYFDALATADKMEQSPRKKLAD